MSSHVKELLFLLTIGPPMLSERRIQTFVSAGLILREEPCTSRLQTLKRDLAKLMQEYTKVHTSLAHIGTRGA